MARYALDGCLRPPFDEIRTDRVMLTWDEETLTTPYPSFTQAIDRQSYLEVQVNSSLPDRAKSP